MQEQEYIAQKIQEGKQMQIEATNDMTKMIKKLEENKQHAIDDVVESSHLLNQAKEANQLELEAKFQEKEVVKRELQWMKEVDKLTQEEFTKMRHVQENRFRNTKRMHKELANIFTNCDRKLGTLR